MIITDITAKNSSQREIIRLAAYCRVSSDSEDQLHSFAAQIRYYKDYEIKNPQYKLIDIYADEGLSGTSMGKRDEMQRLLIDCKKGKIDQIITKSVSRFARNTQELLTILRSLKEIGVGVYFEEQDINTDKLNSEMIITFPGMAAQQESESISGNMRWSYKKRMESGEFNCCTPAYGYDLKNGEMVVNGEESNVIQRIFNLYLQGMGKQTIANILNGEKICRRYGREKWHMSAIDYILNNERYIGDAVLQKTFTSDTLPFKRYRNKGQYRKCYVENSNPPIISKETFIAVQKLQNSRNNKEIQKNHYPLTGIIKCPECGRNFRRQVVKETAYWICIGRSSGATDCKSIRLKEDSIYNAFIDMMEKLTEYRKSLLGWLIRQIELMQNRISLNHNEISKIDKEIASLLAQNIIIARLHTNGILNSSEYAAQSSEVNNKISILRAKRKRTIAEDENDELLDTLKDLNNILENYQSYSSFNHEVQEIFEQVVQSITALNNTEIRFKIIGGIELTERIQEKGRCKSK